MSVERQLGVLRACMSGRPLPLLRNGSGLFASCCPLRNASQGILAEEQTAAGPFTAPALLLIVVLFRTAALKRLGKGESTVDVALGGQLDLRQVLMQTFEQ